MLYCREGRIEVCCDVEGERKVDGNTTALDNTIPPFIQAENGDNDKQHYRGRFYTRWGSLAISGRRHDNVRSLLVGSVDHLLLVTSLSSCMVSTLHSLTVLLVTLQAPDKVKDLAAPNE